MVAMFDRDAHLQAWEEKQALRLRDGSEGEGHTGAR